MRVIKTKLDGCVVIEPIVHRDSRGFFLETFNASRYKDIAGIDSCFVQDNRSFSTKGVLRGLHYQKKFPQGKLVTVTSGSVFDVAVDLRPQSETFGQYESIILSSENHLQFYIPPGFAHGFCVLSEQVDFSYKCTDFYMPDDEAGIYWNDPDIGIPWPISHPVLSEKDEKLPHMNSIKHKLWDLD